MEILECVRAYKRSGHSCVLCQFGSQHNHTRKFEFCDRGGQRLKTLTLTNYKRYGNIWRPEKQTMVNHLAGKTTMLDFGALDFGACLRGSDFGPPAPKRLQMNYLTSSWALDTALRGSLVSLGSAMQAQILQFSPVVRLELTGFPDGPAFKVQIRGVVGVIVVTGELP